MVDYTTLVTFLMIALIVISIALGWFISCRVSDIRYQNAITRYLNKIEEEEFEEENEAPKIKAVEIDVNKLPEEMQDFLRMLEEEVEAQDKTEEKK